MPVRDKKPLIAVGRRNADFTALPWCLLHRPIVNYRRPCKRRVMRSSSISVLLELVGRQTELYSSNARVTEWDHLVFHVEYSVLNRHTQELGLKWWTWTSQHLIREFRTNKGRDRVRGCAAQGIFIIASHNMIAWYLQDFTVLLGTGTVVIQKSQGEKWHETMTQVKWLERLTCHRSLHS